MSGNAEQDLSWMIEALNGAPFHRFLRLEFTEIAPGQVTIRLPFREELLVTKTYLHGGIVATLLDTAGDFAVSSRLGRTVSTIDMRVDYLRPAPAHCDLFARARALRVGRTTAVADVEAFTDDGETVAFGRALFAVPK